MSCCGKCDYNQREKHPGNAKARKQRDLERNHGDVKALRLLDEKQQRKERRQYGDE